MLEWREEVQLAGWAELCIHEEKGWRKPKGGPWTRHVSREVAETVKSVNGMGWAIGSKDRRRWRNSEHHR